MIPTNIADGAVEGVVSGGAEDGGGAVSGGAVVSEGAVVSAVSVNGWGVAVIPLATATKAERGSMRAKSIKQPDQSIRLRRSQTTRQAVTAVTAVTSRVCLRMFLSLCVVCVWM